MLARRRQAPIQANGPQSHALPTILGKKSVRDMPGCTANTSTPVPCSKQADEGERSLLSTRQP